MKKIAIAFLALLSGASLFAQDLTNEGNVNKDITPFNDAAEARSGIRTSNLQQQAAWKQFVQQHPSWGATFSRYTQLPHRAFGQPIVFAAGGNDPVAKAKAFLQTELAGFNLPLNELVLTRSYNDGKYINVDFKQVHNGMDILWSRVNIRFSQDLKIVLMGIDLHRNIPNLNTSLTPNDAIQFAEQAITSSSKSSIVNSDLKLFPVPVDGKYEYHIVYEVTVSSKNEVGMPGIYQTYVDATTGNILYRTNKVKHFDGKVKGNVYPINQYTQTENRPMKDLKMVVNGVTYYTDSTGTANLPSGPATATISLEGKWVKVLNSSAGATTSANYTYTFANTGDSTTFDITALNANDRGVNVYYHVDEIHDYMKTKYPAFTAMDNPLPANVDLTSSTCNAFYTGSDINFYAAGGGCNAFSYIGDVMKHEYGHGINDKFYQSQGGSFDNGGMGEGYADTWANCILRTGTIGLGYTNSNTYIRIYTQAPKVYPQDLTGEVHDDGEIIAGAWWDVGVNMNSIDSMSNLFAKTFYALTTGPNGTEGVVYHDILIDALNYDDDNANLNDGTPHFNQIVQAFARHGIYLLSSTTLTHDAPGLVQAGNTVVFNASATVDYPAFLGDVKLFFRKKGTTPIDSLVCTKVGTDFSVTFPHNSMGDIYEYYFNVYDNSGSFAVSSPIESKFSISAQERNLPYYVVVGYSSVSNENFDNAPAGWTIGNLSGDNATAGKWIVATPVSSVTNGDTCQTGHDHTTGSGKCAITANAGSATSQIGSADVDGGRTSILTAPINLATYNSPVISYWRWYSNSQSATNPRKDQWKVYASYDAGASWLQIEKTFQPDVRWRRNIMIPNLTLGNTIQFLYIATDSVITGGGTVVEAALDDFEILELSATGINDLTTLQASIYPNPAQNEVTILVAEKGNMSYSITNSIGETLMLSQANLNLNNKLTINTSSLANGIYFVRLKINNKQVIQKLTIAK